ncbi:LolA family protein [Flavihumibacter petaseus]|uniref:Putative outer membrane lipoprotein carrier protein n=1 Tax=Flavihumibacter petaseus NBRC 106054 TaxID=1220578 RepID=A0A0E9N6Y2_9BACT|nr:outer membrane lipoprotein carrier protein LolA [Flavihumibacter petaseus]GAO45558.1 putative outer membrane lipoprotein carrier protein [Flavihumibacter petaseus NBRC 106054]
MTKSFAALALVFGLLINNIASAQNDPAAKQILDAVSAKFKTFKAVQSNFTLQVEDGNGKVQGAKKGIVYMKEGKYKVDITGQEIFCDGKNIWTYDKAANEVTITKFDGGQNTITPQKLFTNFYDKDFLYKLNGEKKTGNKVLQEIELTPTDKSKPFHKVYVYVDKATKAITQTKVLEKNGNKYTYSVVSMNGKATISDDFFVFNKAKYPGVEEVDLR